MVVVITCYFTHILLSSVEAFATPIPETARDHQDHFSVIPTTEEGVSAHSTPSEEHIPLRKQIAIIKSKTVRFSSPPAGTFSTFTTNRCLSLQEVIGGRSSEVVHHPQCRRPPIVSNSVPEISSSL